MANTVSRILSDSTLSRIIQIESGGNPNAKARTSSATGLGQFLDGTWLATVKKHRPDLAASASRADLLAMRTEPRIAIEMLARFTEDNAKALGAGYTDGDLYLAHFSGVGVAKKLLRADAQASASTCYDQAAINANRSILEGKTVGEVRAWAARRMASSGRTNWVAKFYGQAAQPAPVDETPVKIDEVAPVAPEVVAQGSDATVVRGDPEIWHIQRRLKAMNYNPGDLDGKWGGKIAGAISGFLNDRPLEMAAPTSFDMFKAARERIKTEIGRAEAEGFKRPVSVERSTADQKTVEELAPEVVPVRRNFLATLWASICTFAVAVYNSVSGYIKSAWDFFTDHKDDIPTESGFFSTAFDYVAKVPTSVWLALAGCGLAFVAFNSMRGVQKITASVQTGER